MNTSDDSSESIQAAEHFLDLANVRQPNPDFKNLEKILRRFSQLPYENLSKIIKLNRNWNQNHFRFPKEIIDDHVRFNLGGTCFSLTLFLKTILDHLGFDTDFLMADMPSGTNTHCALLLRQNGKEQLIDPGYLLNRPLDLSVTNPGHFIYLEKEPGLNRFSLWTPSGKQMKKRYTFTKTGVDRQTFLQYWEASFHLMTMHGICLSKHDQDGFVYLHNHYIKREGRDINYKGKFSEEISEIAGKYFNIPEDLVIKAEQALKENLQQDKAMGLRVPKWVQ